MNADNILKYSRERFTEEMVFSTSRSGGPGGQNVNKVNTKVELRFNIKETALLTDEEKLILRSKLSNKINNRGELILVSEKHRTQLKNKQEVMEKFFSLIIAALTPPKKRIPVKPTKASKEKRLKSKKILSDKKKARKMPETD
jgi:ribosome-associated protein